MALIVLAFALVSALRRRDLVWPAAMLALALIYFYTLHRQSPYVAAKGARDPSAAAGARLRRRADAVARRRELAISRDRRWSRSGRSSTCSSRLNPATWCCATRRSDPTITPTSCAHSGRCFTTGRRWFCSTTTTHSGSCSAFPSPRPRLGSPIPAPVQAAEAVDIRATDRLRLGRRCHAQPLRLRDHDPDDRSERAAVRTSTSSAARARMRCGNGSARPRPRSVLPESGQPGAILDCTTALPAGDSRASRAWRAFARNRVRQRRAAGTRAASEQLTLRLPPGTWDLSLPFVSPQAVTVRGGGLDVRLPPNLDRPGEHLAGRARSKARELRSR